MTERSLGRRFLEKSFSLLNVRKVEDRHQSKQEKQMVLILMSPFLSPLTVLKRLKALNLSQCAKLTDKCFFYIKGLESDSC